MSRSTTDGVERKISGTLKNSASTERKRSASEVQGAGAVDEDVFYSSFIPSITHTAYSSKDLTEIIGRIKDNLAVPAEEWEKRVEALKTLRAVVSGGAMQFDEFIPLLKSLESLVDGCLRDLRSSVVREACITVAYLSQELGHRFDRFAEGILPTMIALILNSAKIMASSGTVAIRFVLQNTHSPRLLPQLTGYMTSKSNVTRRSVCDFLELIFRLWPINVLEKHLGILQDALRRGISDADQEARGFARRAFSPFAEKFPSQASSMLQNIDVRYRKLIEKDLAGAGLSGLLAAGDNGSNRNRPNSQSANPVTRRPTKPVLGTTAIGANGARTRPPVTNQNDFNTMGRYVRQGSMAPTGGSKARTTGRKHVTQSQPTSREVSPSRLGYMSYGIPGDNRAYNAPLYGSRGAPVNTRATGMPDRQAPSTRIPRSQGASRETSPARSVTGGYSSNTYQHANYLESSSGFGGRSANTSSMRSRGRPSLTTMSDCGDFTDNSFGNTRQAFESDDNFSETSSQCSERSGRSVSGFRRQPSVRVTSNLKEIVNQLSSTQWSDRKDGLINLQNYMRSGNPLAPDEIQNLTVIFSRMFADSQSKVVGLFMDTLQFFIKEYNPVLRDWLYVLLIRLLHRQGTEVLGSHQKAIQETLFVLRSHFPLNLQFNTCCRFVMDNTQTPNIKVKVCLLEYLKDLILMMSPDAISAPSSEMSSAIARIISWSAEPKSADVRRMASRVVIKLYDLNSTSFSTILQSSPRSIQDRAAEVLKAYQKTATGGGMSNIMDSAPTWKATSVDQDSHLSYGQPAASNDTGRMSPETLNHMIRQTTEGLQSLTTGIQGPGSGVPRRTSDGAVLNSAPYDIQHRSGSSTINGTGSVSAGVLRTMQPNNILNSPSPNSNNVPSPVSNSYAPTTMSDPSQFMMTQQSMTNSKPFGTFNFDHGDAPKLKKPVIGYQTLKKIREMPPEDIMSEIMQELSNHNERHEQRKTCMLKLIKLLRDGTICNWDEYFKPTLLILLETLGDDGSETRALALKVLQELVRTKPELVHEFSYLFVLKVLDACRDEEKTVIRSAEDCAKTVAQYLPPDLCFSVLTPIINDWKLQLNLPAVKMQEHVVRHSSPELIADVLEVIIPGLIIACNHEDSAMRKASIFCLVAIALKIGESIWEHLGELHVSRRRLLKLYIDRELDNNAVSTESLGARS